MKIGFVTGTTPDKWARAWRDQQRGPLDLLPVTESEQTAVLRTGAVDMCLVRLPIDRDGLHLVRLYEELPVVVAGREHWVAAADADDAVPLTDLAEEQLVLPHRSGWAPSAAQLAWPPMSEKDAVETVAAGTGIALMPMSVARLFARKDIVHRVVDGLDPTEVGLAWLIDRDDDTTQAFVGVVRGRTGRSSR